MVLVGRKDADAFKIIYDRHGDSAYSVAYRIFGDREMAQDVTQEVFLSIWRSNAGYDRARGSVRSWMLEIVRNRAIDSLRRSSSKAPKLEHEDDDEVLQALPAEERTDVETLRRETARELREALSALPQEQSKVIGLAYFGGFSHGEIAEMLGMPLGTVKGRIRLGLEKIRLELAEDLR